MNSNNFGLNVWPHFFLHIFNQTQAIKTRIYFTDTSVGPSIRVLGNVSINAVVLGLIPLLWKFRYLLFIFGLFLVPYVQIAIFGFGSLS